jgi:hypothetical protein
VSLGERECVREVCGLCVFRCVGERKSVCVFCVCVFCVSLGVCVCMRESVCGLCVFMCVRERKRESVCVVCVCFVCL